MQPLIEHFEKYLPLKKEEKRLIEERVSLLPVKRRQIILQAGAICKHYSYVVKGCFKMYSIDDNGTKHNIQFAAEGDWIADIGSFHSNKPSQLFIEAIELLTEITCPVLVMAGDSDGGNAVEHIVNTARMISKHQISIIPNKGHGCFLENFEATWASIVPFLKD